MKSQSKLVLLKRSLEDRHEVPNPDEVWGSLESRLKWMRLRGKLWTVSVFLMLSLVVVMVGLVFYSSEDKKNVSTDQVMSNQVPAEVMPKSSADKESVSMSHISSDSSMNHDSGQQVSGFVSNWGHGLPRASEFGSGGNRVELGKKVPVEGRNVAFSAGNSVGEGVANAGNAVEDDQDGKSKEEMVADEKGETSNVIGTDKDAQPLKPRAVDGKKDGDENGSENKENLSVDLNSINDAKDSVSLTDTKKEGVQDSGLKQENEKDNDVPNGNHENGDDTVKRFTIRPSLGILFNQLKPFSVPGKSPLFSVINQYSIGLNLDYIFNSVSSITLHLGYMRMPCKIEYLDKSSSSSHDVVKVFSGNYKTIGFDYSYNFPNKKIAINIGQRLAFSGNKFNYLVDNRKGELIYKQQEVLPLSIRNNYFQKMDALLNVGISYKINHFGFKLNYYQGLIDVSKATELFNPHSFFELNCSYDLLRF